MNKYKANKDYFKDMESSYQIQKANIQQFANYVEAVNNKIKTSPLEKRYFADDGKSLGFVNDTMTEVNLMILDSKMSWNKRHTGISRFSTSQEVS
nr:hypothetical protein [Catenibacterium mitsuokai]